MSRETFTEPESHPSYGVVSISRTSGTPRALVGSNIKHGNTITLSISEAVVYRNYQTNLFHDKKELIQVEMSAAQFAECITTLNVGCGVPVTIRRVDGVHRESPPEVDFKGRAMSELKEEMAILAERINELSKDAKQILTQKGPIKAGEKEKILKDIMFLEQEVKSNIPFAHKCFQQAVDETVVQAKAEVDNTLTTMREMLGQKVIDGGIEIPLLN